MRRALVLLSATLVASAALAGCVGESESEVRVLPYLGTVETAPGAVTPLAFHVKSTDGFRQRLDVSIESLPQGWTFSTSTPTLEIDGFASIPLVVHVTVASDAPEAKRELRLRVGDTREPIEVAVRAPTPPPATEGARVSLLHVSWLANGTVAETNVGALSNQTAIPLMPNATRDDAENPEAVAFDELPPAWRDALRNHTAPTALVRSLPTTDGAPIAVLLQLQRVEAASDV